MNTKMLQRLVDESDIRDVIHRYALSVDRKRWDELSSCFSEQIEADFTAAGIKKVFIGPREQWIDGIKRSNNGMDATLHTLSNVRIRVNGDLATASCAFYVINILANPAGDSHYQVGGFYDFEFKRLAGEWRIAKYIGAMQVRTGNPYIFKLAHSRSAKASQAQGKTGADRS